jgi:O-acetyl-ADP-ribose deacetylase (regulator of RNase III)
MITYIDGDATNPTGDGHKLIIHCCNDIGGWGRGFVLALSNKWKEPEYWYRKWYEQRALTSRLDTNAHFRLGNIQYVPVEKDITVINMIGQKGIKPENGISPIRYDAIRSCLKKVAEFASAIENSTIHAPKFGAGLAGGDWSKIEVLINEELKAFSVTIYDFAVIA